MSETMEVLLNRRSVRSYKPDMVPKEIIETIVKAGTYAPTGMGSQAPIILAVTNRHLCPRPLEEQIPRICSLRPRGIILREKDLPEKEVWKKISEN